jgi:hypothetical protein
MHFGSQPVYETPYNQWNRRSTELFISMLKSQHDKHKPLHNTWRRAQEAYKMLLENRTQTLAVLLDFRE